MRFTKFSLFIFFCASLLWQRIACAQTNRIEIYKTTFEHASDQSQRLKAALLVCSQYHSLNIDTLYHYVMVAKQLASAQKDQANNILANTFLETWLARKNLFDSALKICNNDLKDLRYTNAGDAYSQSMMQKCCLLMKTGRQKDALDQTYHFLEEAEMHEDTASQIYCKFIIGNVYRNMEQTELAFQWFYNADHTAMGNAWEEIKNGFGIYFQLGMMYNWKNVSDLNSKDSESDSAKAIYYLDRAINDSRKFENLAILARVLNVKAAVIGNKKHLAEERSYVMEARNIYEQLHDTLSILNSISPMCFYYIDEGHPEKGINECLKGIEMVKRGNSYPLIDLYEVLGQCYKASGNYVKYGETLNTEIQYKDSLYKKNSERDLAELNAKYEDQKKQNIIIHQKLDIAAKKNVIYIAFLLSGLLLLSVGFIFRYYQKKQKEQKQKALLAVSKAEEAERKRISADLHDNIGVYAAAAASSILAIEPKDAQSRNLLSQLKENMQDMIAQLNDSIWALNKKSMLLTAVSDRFKTFVHKLVNAYPNILVSVEEQITNDRTLSAFQALHLYRIMQEGLNNAFRHSGCTTVSIYVFSNEKLMQVSVVDNGTGIQSIKENGNGIGNLKARAKESGWDAEWVNNNDGGLSVVISSRQSPTTTN